MIRLPLPVDRPTLSAAWDRAQRLPMGKRVFSRVLGWIAPYSGSIGAEVLELGPGYARVRLRDRRAVRNHLDCVHAIALMNLGEIATGLAVLHAIDGDGRGIVTHLEMDYLKKARGTITAECRETIPLEPGRHDRKIKGTLRDESGDIVARVTAGWKVEIGRQG